MSVGDHCDHQRQCDRNCQLRNNVQQSYNIGALWNNVQQLYVNDDDDDDGKTRGV